MNASFSYSVVRGRFFVHKQNLIPESLRLRGCEVWTNKQVARAHCAVTVADLQPARASVHGITLCASPTKDVWHFFLIPRSRGCLVFNIATSC